MKKFICITCPYCDREQRVRFKHGLQIVPCDTDGIGCGRSFALEVSLEIEEMENATTHFYESEVFKLVSVFEEEEPGEMLEMALETAVEISRTIYAKFWANGKKGH